MATLLGVLGLGLAFLVPGHYLPWMSFQQQWLAAVAAALLALGAIARSEGPARWPAFALVALVTSAIPMLQWLAGQVAMRSDAVLAGLYLGGFALAIAAAASVDGRRRDLLLNALCGALIAAGIASTGMALYQWLHLPGTLYVADLMRGGRPFANLAQPNHLSTLLAMSFACALLWYEQRRIGGPVMALTAAWFGFGMLMSQSRTAWLFGAALVLLWAALHRRAGLRMKGVPLTIGVLCFVAAVAFWGRIGDALYLSTYTLDGRLEPGARTLIVPVMLDAVAHAPWLGYGWNQLMLAQLAVAADHPSAHYLFGDSHNLFLDLVLSMGLPLGLALSGLLVAWFVLQWRACRDAASWTMLLAISAVGVHAMVEYPYAYSYFLLPAGLFIGMLDRSTGAIRSFAAPRATVVVPVLLLGAMLVWIGVEYMDVEQANRQMRLVKARVGPDKMPLAPPPEVWLLDGPREAHRLAFTEGHAGMSAAELDRMATLARRNAGPANLLRYAKAAGLNGRPADASLALAQLCKINFARTCQEARAAWRELQVEHPALRDIAFPPDG